MDRFWQRPGNSNTSLSLSVALSHIDTTDAAEIPWYFFDASVVYFNPYCQKPVQLARGKLKLFQQGMWAADKNQVFGRKKRSRQHWPLLICIQRLHNVYTNCFCTRQAVAEWTEKLPILTSQK